MSSKILYYKYKPKLSESQSNLQLLGSKKSFYDWQTSLVQNIGEQDAFVIQNMVVDKLNDDYKLSFDCTLADTYIIRNCFIADISDKLNFQSYPNLKQLMFYNNHIPAAIPLRLFEIRQLETLTLRKNNICDIGARTFDGLVNLTKLDLSENFIKKFTVDHCWSRNCLRELNLSSNNLTVLSNGAFKYFRCLRKLNVADNYLRKIEANIFETNSLRWLDVSKNCLKIDSFQFLNDLERLEYLNMASNQLPALDRKIFDRLTLLLELDVSNCRCDRIDAGSFAALVNLKCLKLSRNSLDGVAADVFKKNLNLEELYLDACGWKKILPRLLNPLVKLKCVYFDGIREFWRGLGKSSLIERLSIVNCDVSKDTIEKINKYKHLTEINITNNKIEELGSSVFETSGKLKELILKSCKISEIDVNALKPLQELTKLDLSENALKTVSKVLVTGALTELNLTHNHIVRLDSSFGSLTLLERLDLHENLLVEIDEVNFASCSQLVHLNLSTNLIEKLSEKSFVNLVNLKELYLNKNRLERLPDDLFDHNCNLVVLNLSDNKLKKLSRNVFVPMVQLQKLLVNRNRLRVIEAQVFDSIRSLEYLNLSENRLEGSLMYLNKLENLKWLDLSQNNLRCLQSDSFWGLQQLKSLFLNDIGVSFMPGNVFHHQTKLMVLSMRRKLERTEELMARSTIL